MNHTTTTYYNVPLEKEQAEIARLKSALEKAEAEISELKSCMWYVRYHNLIDKFENIEQERDEARRWARQFYAQLQQLWKDFIDG